jgi:hypothetical protein
MSGDVVVVCVVCIVERLVSEYLIRAPRGNDRGKVVMQVVVHVIPGCIYIRAYYLSVSARHPGEKSSI